MTRDSLRAAIGRDSSWQATSNGALAAFVGFGSSFAVILHGVAAAGASPAEAASGLFALLIVTGLCSILISVKLRIPLIVAWTTPGAALLASTPPPHGGFAETVGAFLVCGLLITITGFWPAMSRMVGAIPRSLANAMLAGIVFELCLAPVLGLRSKPFFIIIILIVWVVVGRIRRTLAVPAAVIVAVALAGLDLHDATHLSLHLPLILVAPHFSLAAIISIAVPVFVVTMAGQNIPGFAVLSING